MTENNNPVSKFEVSSCVSCGNMENLLSLHFCCSCAEDLLQGLKHGLVCRRCGHSWIPRCGLSRMCPKCKSKLWRIPKKKKEVGYK